METRNDIIKELETLAPALAQLEKPVLFTVPEGYFVLFSERLLKHIEITETATGRWAQISKPELTEKAPAAYFKGFASGLLQQIKTKETAEELKQLAPTLSAIQKTNFYTAPAGYFETLPEAITEAAVRHADVPKTGWLDALNNTLDQWAERWFRPQLAYAFAGSLSVLVIALMTLLKIEQCTDIECKIAALSNHEIDAYIESHYDEFAQPVIDYKPSESRMQEEQMWKDILENENDLNEEALYD